MSDETENTSAFENAELLNSLSGEGEVSTSYTMVPKGTYIGTIDPTAKPDCMELRGPFGKKNDSYSLDLWWKLPDDVAIKYGTNYVKQQMFINIVNNPLTGERRLANKNDHVNANIELGGVVAAVGLDFNGFKLKDLFFKSALLEVGHVEDNRDKDKPVAERRKYAQVVKVRRIQQI